MYSSLKRRRDDAAHLGRTPEVIGPAPLADEGPDPKKKMTAACTACRKQKVRKVSPFVQSIALPRHISFFFCGLHILQTLMRSRQIGLLGEDVASIFNILQTVCCRLEIEPPQPLKSLQESADHCNSGQSANAADDAEVYELSAPASPSTLQAPIEPYLSGGRLQQHDASLSNGGESERPDLISKGLIAFDLADLLVQRYLVHFDRFLYGIARKYRDATEVRKASPTLLAAMCAVSAFHDVDHKDVFAEYRALVSASLFEKRGVEYVRALCIGSFWLLDASRILLSDAIRRAADCRLHDHFQLLVAASPAELSTSPSSSIAAVDTGVSDKAKEDARDKVRLWYLLFISDRHLTILHNRDSVIRQEKDAIEQRDLFLADKSVTGATYQDVRLLSQVSLLVIMGHIRDTIGCEQSRPIPKSFSVQFAHFAHELDQWYERFAPSLKDDQYIGTFPLAGLKMHHQYARLYLTHHVFRGLGEGPIPGHFIGQAATAHEAAVAIFAVVLENEAFRTNILGMPPYFHVMISFAGHFLLEVVIKKHREQLGIAPEVLDEDLKRVAAVLALFARTPAMPQHPIARAVAGLSRRMNECTAVLGLESIFTGSPFQNPDYASLMLELEAGARDGGPRDAMAEGMTMSSFDLGAMGGSSSEDFLFTDFSGFGMVFPDAHSHFGPGS
ncbi:uncharacterized protein B0I36DRAFT_393950 [Microdochium trichocladiopsis]|uniref:Transcription factor domain-containing protein n=1 Tax=Microdochium trichocladiopsis TaxID=1682393 RepID=A0A9P9BKR2_9PEZI|nr:uncharacterized protein B0I36DRAFT_393950 [Microdochium trichocladiopsis]KAH7021476.1 hypothetical protein B0I36DRAFT_393950 [Microdochium trichocladiopsis]